MHAHARVAVASFTPLGGGCSQLMPRAVGQTAKMNALARILRSLAKIRFRLLGLATIKDIPTARFDCIAKELVAAGWCKTYEYDGFDAWIDYGEIETSKARRAPLTGMGRLDRG